MHDVKKLLFEATIRYGGGERREGGGGKKKEKRVEKLEAMGK